MLKEALLGRTLENMTARPNHAFRDICRQIARVDTSIQDAIALAISNTVMAPVQFAREGLEELAAASERTGFPAILHTATSTIANVIALASRYQGSSLIAAHCNHPSFTPQEAVSAACRLRELGVTIDVSTLDTISTRWRNTPDNLDALIDARLADTLSTDFAGGHWDGILDAIHRMISRKQLPAPAAVALSTGNVARRFPLFADRGLIEVGKRADIVIADSKNLGRVRDVIIGGKIVVQDGALVASPQR
jgi:imidazolonepropionase-like amidohydrolase